MYLLDAIFGPIPIGAGLALAWMCAWAAGASIGLALAGAVAALIVDGSS